MKSVKTFTAILLFSLSVLFINCSPNLDAVPTKQEIITNGKWQVNYFSTDINLTSQYVNTKLLFNTNGTILIEGDETATGLWNISNENILQVFINTHNTGLQQLNGDWNIVECNNNTCNLEKSNTQPSQLRITKI